MIAALVPACGQSRRMGRPKLTLPVGGEPLIARVVQALLAGGVDQVVVVVGPPGQEGSLQIQQAAAAVGATVVTTPEPTRDMRATIVAGLDVLERSPNVPAAVLLAPGDMPSLAPDVVRRVIGCWRATQPPCVVPMCGGRRGHPLALAWEQAREIRQLPHDRGVNWLLDRPGAEIMVCDVDDSGILGDIDTPEEYAAWSAQHG